MRFLLKFLEFFDKPSVCDMPAKPGKNDCCWCGSGRKYKECHLGEDFLKRTLRKEDTCSFR